MKKYIYKILFKLVELILRLFTGIKYFFESDKTKILLKHREKYVTEKEQEIYCHNLSSFSKKNVLIIIPFKDKWSLTYTCLQSLSKQKFENILLHVVLVNNNSQEETTLTGIKKSSFEFSDLFSSFKVENNPIPFNFSKLNNDAVKNFTTTNIDIILFLNNDIEFQTEHDLEKLISFFSNTKKIGALGCTLTYPTNNNIKTIQHTFLAPGVKQVGAHPLKGKQLNLNSEWFKAPRIVPCVTGAVLLISYDTFIALEGFDEELATAYQDVDLCLKCQKQGLQNWTLTQTVLTHHESVSRPRAPNKSEMIYIYKKWGSFLTKNPLYSLKYSRWSETPIESLGEGDYPWEKSVL